MQPQYICKNDYGTYYYSDKKMTRYHRTDGPAIEWNDGGEKFWYVDGKLHRLDGPAVEYADGSKYWYVDGKELTEDEFNKRTKSNRTIEINGRRFTIEELNVLIAGV